jgi:hypothetical protein
MISTIKHPPAPFKGGFTISAIPPLKGVGGCSTVFELIQNLKIKLNNSIAFRHIIGNRKNKIGCILLFFRGLRNILGLNGVYRHNLQFRIFLL